jgi:hypothetical protein
VLSIERRAIATVAFFFSRHESIRRVIGRALIIQLFVYSSVLIYTAYVYYSRAPHPVLAYAELFRSAFGPGPIQILRPSKNAVLGQPFDQLDNAIYGFFDRFLDRYSSRHPDPTTIEQAIDYWDSALQQLFAKMFRDEQTLTRLDHGFFIGLFVVPTLTIIAPSTISLILSVLVTTRLIQMQITLNVPAAIYRYVALSLALFVDICVAIALAICAIYLALFLSTVVVQQLVERAADRIVDSVLIREDEAGIDTLVRAKAKEFAQKFDLKRVSRVGGEMKHGEEMVEYEIQNSSEADKDWLVNEVERLQIVATRLSEEENPAHGTTMVQMALGGPWVSSELERLRWIIADMYDDARMIARGRMADVPLWSALRN